MAADLTAALQRAIAKVCSVPLDAVRPDTSLESLGMDSLAVAEVIVELEMDLDVELPVHLLRRLDRVVTVGDVAAELGAALAPIAEGGPPSTPAS